MLAFELEVVNSPSTIKKKLCNIDWIRRKTKPADVASSASVSIIDLYSGCGGMTLGVQEGLRTNGYSTNIKLAVDNNQPALEVYRRNFKTFRNAVKNIDINELVSTKIGFPLEEYEKVTQNLYKGTQVIVAGPPCQGHSNLNNHTRRSDPRNNLYLNAIRFVEIIKPSIAIIENVSTVIHDKDNVVLKAEEALKNLGYQIQSIILNASKYGIAQSRKRHFQIATLKHGYQIDFNPYVLENASLFDYIEDIMDEDKYDNGLFCSPSITQKLNRQRIDLLFDNDLYDLPDEFRPDCHKFKNHSYKSCYGRLHPNKPAQTITSGFGSMGQGRYIHPLRRRVITPHEAARIQGFPDFFNFKSTKKRGDLHTMIANAVPPKLVAMVIDFLLTQNAL